MEVYKIIIEKGNLESYFYIADNIDHIFDQEWYNMNTIDAKTLESGTFKERIHRGFKKKSFWKRLFRL